jgi:hypothetical protein
MDTPSPIPTPNRAFSRSVIDKSVSDIYERAIEEWTVRLDNIGWYAVNRLNEEIIYASPDVIKACCSKHAKEVLRVQSKMMEYRGDRDMCCVCCNFYVLRSSVKDEWKNICEKCDVGGKSTSPAYVEVMYVKCDSCDNRIPPNPNKTRCSVCGPVSNRTCTRCQRQVILSTDPIAKTMCTPCLTLSKKDARKCNGCKIDISDQPKTHKECIDCFTKSLRKCGSCKANISYLPAHQKFCMPCFTKQI